jgi:hypothetical protein
MRCRVTMKSGIGVIGVALVKMIVMVVEMKKLTSNLSSSCRMINQICQ